MAKGTEYEIHLDLEKISQYESGDVGMFQNPFEYGRIRQNVSAPGTIS